MALQVTSVNWREAPNRREKVIFFIALLVSVFVFLKSCWLPSREALSGVQINLEETLKKKEALAFAQKQFGKPEKKQSASEKTALASYAEWAHKIAQNPSGVVMQEMTNPRVARGGQVTRVEFQDEVHRGNFVSQGFTVSLFGSFPFVGRYLERLEELPIPWVIDHWEITSSIEGASGVKLTLEGVAYGWE